jgi:hypothetical protein
VNLEHIALAGMVGFCIGIGPGLLLVRAYAKLLERSKEQTARSHAIAESSIACHAATLEMVLLGGVSYADLLASAAAQRTDVQ